MAKSVDSIMSLETRIDWIGHGIRILVKNLAELGYQFERQAEVFPGPEPGTADAIGRIEREIGAVRLARNFDL
jgi:hypothetical protein